MSKSRRGQGEGSIYKTKAGNWRGAVDLGWKDGQRQRKYVSGKTRAEVQRKVADLVKQNELGKLVAGRVPTVAEWMEVFLRDYQEQAVRTSSYNRYAQEARLYINPNLGHMKLDKLMPHHLTSFYREMGEKLSPASVRRLHYLLRLALNVAVMWNVIPLNPVLAVRSPSGPRRDVEPWTIDETRAFLQHVAEEPMLARWQLAVVLGMRQGEVLGLAWRDIDFGNKTLFIRQCLQYQSGNGLVFVEPKTATSRRVLPLPEPVLEALRRWREKQDQLKSLAGDGWVESGLVFTTSHGTPISPRNDYRTFKRLSEAAGLSSIRLHDLRHTAASNMIARGVHPRVVMETLGHSQISMTMNTYSHVAPSVSREMADMMATAVMGA